jgi:hypothetical protein
LRLFMAVIMTSAERTGLCHQYSLSPLENFTGGVVDTCEQFVVNTAEQFMAGVITFSPGVVDTGQK